MNTEKLYTAQLNVSKFFNNETINDLILRLKALFAEDNIIYNEKTNTIDIARNRISNIEDDINIRMILKEWIKTLPADQNDIDIITNNIEFIFNITKLGYPNIDKHIINIYLY